MLVVKQLDRDNILDIVKYVEDVYKINNEEIVLTISSNLGFGETFLYVYEIMKMLLEKGIVVKRGPLVVGDTIIVEDEVLKLKNTSLEDKIWWLVYNGVVNTNVVCLNEEMIEIKGYVLKRGWCDEYRMHECSIGN